MSLQKKITLLVSCLIFFMTLTIVLVSVAGANKNFSVQRLTQLETEIPSENNQNDSTFQKEQADFGIILAKAKLNFSSKIIFGWIVLLFVGTYITYKVIGKCLYPLIYLKNHMSNLDAKTIGKKIEINKQQTKEIQELSSSYNEMTSRLKISFIKQKNFINNAAHELKTPLSVIATYTQLIQMSLNDSNKELDKYIDIVEKSCENLSIIMDQLLVLANDNLIQLSDLINLNCLIDEVCSITSTLAKEKDISLNKHIKNEINFNGNKAMFDVVIKNLIENAIKYADKKSVVMIVAEVINGMVIIEVKNKTKKIRLEEIDLIFEPFYRGKNVNNNIIGSGLGLPLVKKIIESHSGEISCSMQGNDISFIVSIPY